MEKIEQILGRRIRELRMKEGLTQSDLAKIAETSLTTINRLEMGKQLPHDDTIEKICAYFSMTIYGLISSSRAKDSADSTDAGATASSVLSLISLLSSSTMNQDQVNSLLATAREFVSKNASAVNRKGG